jgi:hypothetical protein
LKPLPFYDDLDVLLPPSPLVPKGKADQQKTAFEFSLTTEQVTKIHDFRNMVIPTVPQYDVQVLLRLCKFETTCEQSDFYPINFEVDVNSTACPLPVSLSQILV